jgi:myo-inositol-1(or 4)-monophosphatase
MQPMLNIALTAARKAGQLILRASEELDMVKVEEKGKNDFVSEVDRRAEDEIIYHIHKAYPEHGIEGEEGGVKEGRNGPSDYVWVIDPIDGTTNFLRGIPHYAISIACKYRGKVEHGLVYDPVRDEAFSASRGRGAKLNDRRIRVSSLKTLDGALIGTGIPFRSHADSQLPAYIKSLEAVARETAGIRRAGAASLDLAYVAAGRLDGFWEIGLKEWDIAAGALLVQEAGGMVGDFKGGNTYLNSGNIVAANPKCFKSLLQTVNRYLGDC